MGENSYFWFEGTLHKIDFLRRYNIATLFLPLCLEKSDTLGNRIEKKKNMTHKFDFLVIGSGIAGMSFALKVAEKGRVAVICKTGLEEANTFYAQGGIASVTNTLVDNFEKHIEDTMIAGDWSAIGLQSRKWCGKLPVRLRSWSIGV